MKTKTIKQMSYNGLGFPIILNNVAMVEINHEWHPKIDVRKIADLAIKELASQRERFTGNQIKFIRLYFSMSLREFAQTIVNESHTAVSKWEKYGDTVTSMDINIEKILRLFIHEKVNLKPSAQHSDFYQKYLTLKKINPTDKHVSCISIAA